MALQGDSDNDPDSGEDDDDLDHLLTVGSKSCPGRSSTLTSSDSSNEEPPVESPEHTSQSLIPVCSKGGATRRFMKHKKIVQSAPYSTKSRQLRRHAEGAEQSILTELRKTNKQLCTLTAKLKKSNQKIHKIEKCLQGGSSSCSSSPTCERKKASSIVPSGIRVRLKI